MTEGRHSRTLGVGGSTMRPARGCIEKVSIAEATGEAGEGEVDAGLVPSTRRQQHKLHHPFRYNQRQLSKINLNIFLSIFKL
jgi:hypothetical protein